MQITNNINKNTNVNTLRCYYTPTRMSEIKTSDNANNIKAMKKRNWWWERQIAQSFWKSVCQLLQKLNTAWQVYADLQSQGTGWGRKMVNSRPAWNIQWVPVSNKQTNQQTIKPPKHPVTMWLRVITWAFTWEMEAQEYTNVTAAF